MKILILFLTLIPVTIFSQCAGNQSFTLSPSPVNGTYQPGTVVTVCYTMDGWNGTNFGSNWIEGFGLTLGPGWVSCTPVTSPDDCEGSSLPQQWLWLTTVTNNSNTLTVGPGYFYEGPTGPLDGNPGNDWGDFGTSCLWTFCVQLQVSDQCDPLSLLVEVTPYADGTMGSWGNESCFDAPFVVFDGSIAGGNVDTSPISSMLDTVCVGLTQIYFVDPTPGSIYDWNLSSGGTLYEDGSNTISIDWGGTPGDYTINVQETTVEGCVGDLVEATITVADTLITFSQARTGICIGEAVTLQAFPADGFWSGENVNDDTFIGYTDGSFFPVYFVNIHGCPTADSIEIAVRPPFLAPIIYTSALEIDLCQTEGEQFFYVNEEPGVQYTWHVDGALQIDTDFELYQEWQDSTLTHEITVFGTDSVGCVSEIGYLNIDVESCHRLYVPNSFTPNGDSYNDALKVAGSSVFDLDFKIYDRYGREIYTIRSLSQTWNGNDGNGYFCPNGTYNWIATYKDDEGFRHQEKGHIILIR